MKRFRRPLCLLLSAVLALSASGCQGTTTGGNASQPQNKPVNLLYYTIGEASADLPLVNEALNELLLDRYGFTVTYRRVGWNEYEAYLASLVNTGNSYDIAFSWANNYTDYARGGKWLELTDYLEQDGRALYDVVNSSFWKGVTVDGGIYGIPTNKELATPLHFLFAKELVEKYDIDISHYTTFEELEPLLRMISRSEPDYIPLYMDTTLYDFGAQCGYEDVGYADLPLRIQTGDSKCTVVNLFETAEMTQLLHTMRRYYKAGYINQDACVRSSTSRFSDEKVFLRISSGGPDSDSSYSSTFGYPIVVQQASPGVVTTTSTRGGIMVINAKTRYPDECRTFLMAVNTDPEVRNLLNFGIEGTHYTLTDEGQVQVLSDAYAGVPYTQGNWAILHTRVGESPEKWKIYEEFNKNTQESALLGFSPDFSAMQDELKAVSTLFELYYPALITGSVDPDVFLPQFRHALDKAGMQTLRTVLQNQINRWLSSQEA